MTDFVARGRARKLHGVWHRINDAWDAIVRSANFEVRGHGKPVDPLTLDH